MGHGDHNITTAPTKPTRPWLSWSAVRLRRTGLVSPADGARDAEANLVVTPRVEVDSSNISAAIRLAIDGERPSGGESYLG